MKSGTTDPAMRPSAPPPRPPAVTLTSSARPISSPEMPRSRISPRVRRSFSIKSPARFAASTQAIHRSGNATSSDTIPIRRAMFCIRSSRTSVVLSTMKFVGPNFSSRSSVSPASWLCDGWPVKIFFGGAAVSTAPR